MTPPQVPQVHLPYVFIVAYVNFLPTQIIGSDPPSLTEKRQRAATLVLSCVSVTQLGKLVLNGAPVRSESWKYSKTYLVIYKPRTIEPFSKLGPGFNMDVSLHFLKSTCTHQWGCAYD